MRYLALDIETASLRPEDLPSPIVDYLMRGRSSLSALEPLGGRVVCIGFKRPDSETYAYTDQDEGRLLSLFWEELAKGGWDKLITWNGRRFDVPFLQVRSLVRSIRWSVAIDTSPYKPLFDSNHVDLMDLFAPAGTEFRWIPQEIAGHLLSLEVPPTSISGEDVERAFYEGRLEEIEERCRRDVELTAQIFERVAPLLPLQQPPATERQVQYMLKIAAEKGILLTEEEARRMNRAEATDWIDKNR